MKKMPPSEKVFEAWTAVVDDRIIMHPGYASVTSSDGAKAYSVRFEGATYSSDDNASYWQGYPGYPVIAVLMIQGKLPFDREEAEKWRNVNWKAVNTKFKNNYASAVKFVAEERNIDLDQSQREVAKVMEALSRLDIQIKRKI